MKNKTKRIAIYISSMQGGGAQRAILKTANGIAERGHQVDLVLAHAVGPYLAEVPARINVVDLKAYSVAASLPTLIRYLREQQPDAMLSALNYVNIVALLARRLAKVSTRLVISERNTASISTKKFLRLRGRLLVPIFMKRLYGWADEIVAVSHGVQADLVQFLQLPAARVQVIYNPIITPELMEKAMVELDHPWFRPGEPPVVLAVGRLQPQKDFPLLIEAFARVRATRPARLLILGDGPDHTLLQQQVAAAGLSAEVSLPGFDVNPYAYMKKAAAFVLSSRWEGLPGVLIEALYCGTPLVATDCPSGPKEILANGSYGRLVPVNEVTAMTDAITAALSGEIAPPPADSWRPFELNTVVDNYLRLLVDHDA